jgi:DNA-directed RNA polymerase specialized sigma24 family protein
MVWVHTLWEIKMNDKDILSATVQARKSLRKYAKGRVNEEAIEDLTQDILIGILNTEKEKGLIKNLLGYVDRAARNQIINVLNKEHRRNAPRTYQRFPRQDLDDFGRKAAYYVRLLYKFKAGRFKKNVSFLLHLDLAIRTLEAAINKLAEPISSGHADRGGREFWTSYGIELSISLQDELNKLWGLRDIFKGMKSAYPFPAFVIETLPKLKADQIMLLLRVLYKKFKIRSGKYADRKLIRRSIEKLSPKVALNEKHFETLRRKIYKKTTNPLYDRIAEWICDVASRPASAG